MAAALAEIPVPESVESLEARWIVPGQLGTEMSDWFGRFRAGTETREDAYLIQPRLGGLAVKLRDGSSLDVKSYLGSPGLLDLPQHGRGRLESWRKWSFPADPADHDGVTPPGWVIVRKRRRRSWFPLAAGRDLAQPSQPAAQARCMVELTEAHVRGESWWSVGLEATGSAGLLAAALRHTANQVFAQSLPPGVELSLANSRSYAQWLSQRPGLHAAADGT